MHARQDSIAIYLVLFLAHGIVNRGTIKIPQRTHILKTNLCHEIELIFIPSLFSWLYGKYVTCW